MQAQITTPPFGDTRLPPRFWAKVRIGSIPAHRPELGPCWVWTGARYRKGYGQFKESGQRRRRGAHRLAYETLIGAIPEGLVSDHLCRNPPCVRPGHLEPVSNTVNGQRGHGNKGEAHGNAKLNEVDIPIIRALRGKVSQRALAGRFGVSAATICLIQGGKGWTHV